jgi:6-phosphogluconolactonase/glucosamine-6-phosphate isomerase/deaminase
VTPGCPASIVQQHENCSVFLDEPAASLLSSEV